eukprot:m.1112 g.1112  ORF g.1112 m.1112 type:complete len:77 (-) comp752_c0_seq1:54-284(-)
MSLPQICNTAQAKCVQLAQEWWTTFVHHQNGQSQVSKPHCLAAMTSKSLQGKTNVKSWCTRGNNTLASIVTFKTCT